MALGVHLLDTGAVHLFALKRTAFVLWRPQHTQPAPKLVIGQFEPGNPPALAGRQELMLEQLPDAPDVWAIDVFRCGLIEGQTYHDWFEVTDSSPFRDGRRILCTDPTAFTVDWRLLAPRLPAPYDAGDQDPAAVVKFQDGELVPCDPGGETLVAPPVLRRRTTGWSSMSCPLRGRRDLCRRRVCRSARPEREPSTETARRGQLRPPRRSVPPPRVRLCGAARTLAHHVRSAVGQRHGVHSHGLQRRNEYWYGAAGGPAAIGR